MLAPSLVELMIGSALTSECRRLGRKPIQSAIKTLLDTVYTLVHTNGRKSRVESEKILDDLTKALTKFGL
jgi:hypothetical protein